ncbi:MAG TPA: sulfotransferase [Thermoanaerobaculia bacterium]|nr:sulfotransferase [Thermoanaerobaculia bacterium]
MSRQAPVVIGGMGGSGTRVYHHICALAGFSMGIWNHSRSRDCMPLHRWFFSRWGEAYLSGDLPPAELRRMRRRCRLCLRLANPRQGVPWGFKDPRTLYLLPFFDELYPGMRFIHALRDGRDHAFYRKFPYRAFEPHLLSPEETRLEEHCRKALHWARLNRRAEAWGESRMPGRYLVSRLEDLCLDPGPEVTRILAFLGVDDPQVTERCVQAVSSPSSLGRWRHEPPELVERVEGTVSEELERYGYSGHLERA